GLALTVTPNGDEGTSGDADDVNDDAPETTGGCSTGGGAGWAVLLLGLVAVRRRRRGAAGHPRGSATRAGRPDDGSVTVAGMQRTDWRPLLERTCALALEYYDRLPERPVAPQAGAAAMLAALDRPLPDAESDPREVIEELARTVDPGLTA